MILCIDAGNSNTVLGCVENGKILQTIRITTNPRETSAELSLRLSGLLDFYGYQLSDFEGAILSSVVPELTEQLKEAVTALLRVRCMIVGPGLKTGMNVRIDDPGTLAPDLLTGAVAAMNLYPLPAIIINMGTALTLVAVDEKKSYRGGIILPGIRLSYSALSQRASLLPDISISEPAAVIGRNTVDAMRSGAVYGTAAMIDGLLLRIEQEIGSPCTAVATGRDASRIIPRCTREIYLDEELVLKGLAILYEKNAALNR